MTLSLAYAAGIDCKVRRRTSSSLGRRLFARRLDSCGSGQLVDAPRRAMRCPPPSPTSARREVLSRPFVSPQTHMSVERSRHEHRSRLPRRSQHISQRIGTAATTQPGSHQHGSAASACGLAPVLTRFAQISPAPASSLAAIARPACATLTRTPLHTQSRIAVLHTHTPRLQDRHLDNSHTPPPLAPRTSPLRYPIRPPAPSLDASFEPPTLTLSRRLSVFNPDLPSTFPPPAV